MAKIEEIKAWIKSHGMTRQEFAALVGVRVSSVNNWLSGFTKIPEGRMTIIDAALMQPAAPPPAAVSVLDEVQVIVIKLTRAEYAAVCAAAEAEGKSVEQWARQKILEAAARTTPAT